LPVFPENKIFLPHNKKKIKVFLKNEYFYPSGSRLPVAGGREKMEVRKGF
jgi:hypothetical protein